PLTGLHVLQSGDRLLIDESLIDISITGQQITLQAFETDKVRDTLPPLSQAPLRVTLNEGNDASRRDSQHTVQAISYVPPPTAKPAPSLPKFRPAVLLLAVSTLVLCLAAWFLFSSKAVLLEFEPLPDKVKIKGFMPNIKLGERYLMLPGSYTVTAEKQGYHMATQLIEIIDNPQQHFSFSLEELPGRLTVITRPIETAQLTIDGNQTGNTPLHDLRLSAGTHDLVVRAERYLDYDTRINIEGKDIRQNLEIELSPAWAEISFNSLPSGAAVQVNGQELGKTPLSSKLLQGEYEIQIALAGYKLRRQHLSVVANQAQVLPEVRLERADGRIVLESIPTGANVTVEGNYRGQTPLKLSLAPDRKYRIALSRVGHQSVVRQIMVEADQEQRHTVRLKATMGTIKLSVDPNDAQIYVDGTAYTDITQGLRLSAIPHRLEIRKRGYAAKTLTVTPRPGLNQRLSVKLETLAQLKVRTRAERITTATGQALRLIKPGSFTMGSSRREQGRRSNEVRYPVRLTRPFYLGVKEITNAQFRRFDSSYHSGFVKNLSLDIDEQPVVRLSWEQAARYCNWLSQNESLPPVYAEKNGQWVVIQPIPKGYRLPTEAEWTWASRFMGGSKGLRYPWGETMPPPSRAGNYADINAGRLLTVTLEDYDDSHPVTAPVGSYPANSLGLFDLGGNVAEWVHDYYSFGPEQRSRPVIDPTGPTEGRFHVIRGSSWMHASISELRLSHRDYADKGRPDVGFRIARYAD
ncbi:MAG: PEGA domain-containing protein, partial [Pseudomonadota bacterium]